MRAAALVAFAAFARVALAAGSTLRISAAPATRGGSTSFFLPDGKASTPPLDTGFLWAPLAKRKQSFSDALLYGLGVWLNGDDDEEEGEEDDDDERDDDEAGSVFQRRWAIETMGPPVQSLNVSIDAPVRVFVRSSDVTTNNAVIATVVVRGDSAPLVDNAVEVVEMAPAGAETAAFRVATSPGTFPSGRLLVQIEVHAPLSSLSAHGDSIVVVDDAALLETASFFSTDRATLLVSLDKAVVSTGLSIHARDASALVLQSRATLISSSIHLVQEQHATVALVAERITSDQSVTASAVGGGRLCVHTIDRSAVSVVSATVTGDDGLLQWTSLDEIVTDRLNVRVAGRHARAELRTIQNGLTNATVSGPDAVAVVDASQLVVHASSESRGVAFVHSRPRIVTGSGQQLAPTTGADNAFLTTSPCALAALAQAFPLPLERAVVVPHPVNSDQRPNPEPLQKDPVARQPLEAIASTGLPPPAVSTSPSANSTFVNGSLHMLGSMPYVDAIVVFLASAWILHQLLQCYDRRQRRRTYQPLGDDRVWI